MNLSAKQIATPWFAAILRVIGILLFATAIIWFLLDIYSFIRNEMAWRNFLGEWFCKKYPELV